MTTIYRTIDVSTRDVTQQEKEEKKLTFSFSSEQPVERWFGKEVLDHTAPDFSRLNNGAALLFNHDVDKHIGIVESAWVENGRGYATVRFGENDLAKEKWRDIETGILKKVSFAYAVDFNSIEQRDDIFVIKKWQPLEISFVTVPADNSVGLRAFEDYIQQKTTIPTVEVGTKTINKEMNNMERTDEIREIIALGEKVNLTKEANEFIKQEKTLDEFRQFVIEKLQTRQIENATIGLSDNEAKEFSFVRLFNALYSGDWSKAGFEREVSKTTSQKLNRETAGAFIPLDVLKRNVAKSPASSGGYLVETTLLSANFIELLRDALVANELGVTFLDGLVGDISIPKQLGGANAYWLAEGGNVGADSAQFGVVSLAPKTVGTYYYITRKMLLQASLDVEALIRRDMAATIAGAIDKAIITGSGTGNEPTGILNTTGVSLISLGTNGGVPDYNKIVEMQSVVLNNKVTGTFRYLTNPKVMGKLKTTPKFASTGIPIWEGNTIDGFSASITTAVPSDLTKGTGTNLSAIIFGKFSDVIVGNWGTLEVLPDREYQNGGLNISAFQDVDIAVRYPESFAVIKDAITA